MSISLTSLSNINPSVGEESARESNDAGEPAPLEVATNNDIDVRTKLLAAQCMRALVSNIGIFCVLCQHLFLMLILWLAQLRIYKINLSANFFLTVTSISFIIDSLFIVLYAFVWYKYEKRASLYQ